MRDKKYEIHLIAEELAREKFGRGFYELSPGDQDIVWSLAEVEREERAMERAAEVREWLAFEAGWAEGWEEGVCDFAESERRRAALRARGLPVIAAGKGPGMLRGRCPDCGATFEYPFSDRVDVVLFGNWRKYHRCPARVVKDK